MADVEGEADLYRRQVGSDEANSCRREYWALDFVCGRNDRSSLQMRRERG